jgi:hypothetical protein
LAEAVQQMDDDRLAALERDVVENAKDLVAVPQGIVVATGRK